MAVKKEENTTNNPTWSPNAAAALGYAPFVGWLAAIALLLVEKDKSVRWNAVQALIFGLLIIDHFSIMKGIIVLNLLSPLVWIAGMVIQLVWVVKAYQKQDTRMPYLSELTDRLLKKAYQ